MQPAARSGTSSLLLPPQVSRVAFTPEEIKAKVKEIGRQISLDYAGKELIVFGVLKAVAFFQSDLLREITLPLKADYIAIAGYKPGQTRPSGTVRILKDLDLDVSGRHVLVIEDMVDTGLTLNFILKMVIGRRPASLGVCALLNREAHRLATNLPIRYTGFEAPGDFLVGYGLDYMEQFRALPFIGVLSPELYAS